MQKLIWENSKGERLDLTSAPYGITEWEGFSGIDLNVQTQKVPFQDGSVFIDALYEDRTIAVTLAIYDGNNLETRYRLRRELISALNPKAGEGYLIYKNDFIEKRIRAIANNPIFETHNSDMVGTPKASLSWTCCDPYWEDVEETVIKFMGNMRNQIEYDGDVETGVNLEYVGYSASLEVENINENKQIELQGIGPNRKIDISTLAGKKTIFATDLSKTMQYVGYYTEDYCACNGYLFSPYYDGGLQLIYFDENNIKRNTMVPATVIGNFLHFELVTYCESTGEYYIYDPYTNKIYSSSDLETWTENLYIYKDVGDWVVRVALSGTWEISSDGVTWTPSTMTDFMYVEDLGYYAIDNNNMYYDADDLSAVSVIKHEDNPYRFNYLLQFGEYVVAQTNYGVQGTNIIFKNNVEVTDHIFGEHQYLTRVVPFKNDLVGYVEGGTGSRLINKNFQNLNGLQYEGEYAYPCCYVNDKLYLKLRDGLLRELVFGYTENLQDYTIMNNQGMQTGIKYGDVYFFASLTILQQYQVLYMTNNLKDFSEVFEMYGLRKVKMQKNYIVDYNDIGIDKITGYKIENYTPVVFETSITGAMCNYVLNNFRIFGDTFYFCTGNGLYIGTDFENFTQECNGENVLDVVVTENNTIIITDTNYYLNGNVVTAPDTFKKVEWSDYYQKFLFISDTACYSSMDGLNFELVDGITGNLIDIIYDEKQSLWWILAETTCYTYYMDLLSEIECSGVNGELCLTDKGVAIINQQIQEIIYSRSTNLIGKMTATSDMSLSLKTGTNILTFNGGEKDVLFLKYRKKYIGV